MDNDGTLDKESTSYNDIFDAFRPVGISAYLAKDINSLNSKQFEELHGYHYTVWKQNIIIMYAS